MVTIRFILTRLNLVLALLPLLTFKRTFNLLHAIACFLLGTKRTVKHPPILIVTLTTHCNYSCRMCLKSKAPTSDKGAPHDYQNPSEIDFPALRVLLMEHCNYICFVRLHGGEPLHYSQIMRLVDLLNELKIPFNIVTNGSLLTEALCEKLVGGSCFNIGFSLDAGTETTYRYLRRGGELSVVLRNIERLNSLKEVRGTRRPVVSASMCTFAQNIRELCDALEICAAHHIPSLTVAEGWNYDTDFTRQSQLAGNNVELFADELRKAAARAKKLGIKIHFRFPSLAFIDSKLTKSLPAQVGLCRPKDCLNLYASIWLMPNLDAIGCSNSPSGWGNVGERGLDAVWNGIGSVYANARSDFKRGVVPRTCEGCIYTGSFFS